MSAIPSVDLKDFVSGDPERKDKFVKEIGAAFEDIGFVALGGHFLSDELVESLYSEIKKFFELPQEVKDTYSGHSGSPVGFLSLTSFINFTL